MRILFTSKDLSRVRRYVTKEMGRILAERVNPKAAGPIQLGLGDSTEGTEGT
jgi:hypothetical protein